MEMKGVLPSMVLAIHPAFFKVSRIGVRFHSQGEEFGANLEGPSLTFRGWESFLKLIVTYKSGIET